MLDDAKGVVLTSPNKIDLNGQEIFIKSDKAVAFRASRQLLLGTPTNCFASENETDVLAISDVIIDCNDPTEFPPVDQTNQRKETGITMSGLLIGAGVGLAVVAGLLAFTGVGIPLTHCRT